MPKVLSIPSPMARAFQPAISEANNITKYMADSLLPMLFWDLTPHSVDSRLMLHSPSCLVAASGKVTTALNEGRHARHARPKLDLTPLSLFFHRLGR